MTPEDVVEEITARAWRFGVAVLLSPDAHVFADGLRCGGYFDPAKQPILAVATGVDTDRWLGTLIHEYCHVTQWAENATVWRADTGADWSDWLEGKQVRGIKQRIAASRELEADCERRTVRMIRELDAPVDLDRYIRGANSYIHFYNVMAEKRKWYAKDRGPYSVPAVLELANPTLDDDYSKTPKPLWDALLTCI